MIRVRHLARDAVELDVGAGVYVVLSVPRDTTVTPTVAIVADGFVRCGLRDGARDVVRAARMMREGRARRAGRG